MATSTDPRRARGALGERLAADHLTRRGYTVLERNFRTCRGELDLVAADARSIVFCEVKTRVAGGTAGPSAPLDAVGPAKRARLRRLAAEWLRERAAGVSRPRRDELRFDAIGVTLSPTGELLALEHLEGAF
jgi:putative endonuclease